jgi:hypothetical protein
MESIALYRARARATFLLPQLKSYNLTHFEATELLPVTKGHAFFSLSARTGNITVACCLL